MDATYESEEYSNLTSIQKFYFGRSVFITGASGLTGKVLVEKLLRCCTGIGMLFLLMRQKRGKTVEQRKDAILDLPLFDKVKEVLPEYKHKVHIIDGDLEKERLGISDEDFWLLKDKISIVFHAAARVKFDDTLRVAVQTHMTATKDLLQMCKEMPKLAAFVHVSTTYVHREEDFTVLEKVHRGKVTPQNIMDAFKWIDDKTEAALTDMLTEGTSNTYLVTKILGEVIVEDEHGGIPTAIVRPALIQATIKDPFPGWIDSVQGVSGVGLAVGVGVLRALHGQKGLRGNFIPLDVVVNTIIASAWHVGLTRSSELYIVNCCVDYDKQPLLEADMLKYALTKRDKYPLTRIFRYPDVRMYYWRPLYLVHAFFDQWIPAVIVDFFLYIFTGKTILVKVHRKINFLYGIFDNLGRSPWLCCRENYKALENKLSSKDLEIFSMDVENINWEQYIDDCMAGSRKYLAKDDPSTLPYARKKAYIWWLVTTILKWCLIAWLFYFLFRDSLSTVYHKFEETFYSIPN